MVSPLTIQIMIAHYTLSRPQDMGQAWGSLAGRDCRDWLFDEKLIDSADELGRPTERGKVWIEEMLATPLPKIRWVIPPRTTD